MANYFRCDTTFIKSTNAGGRLFSTKPKVDTELPNGILGYMGDFLSDEVKELLVPTDELIKSKLPVLIHNPEINYREESKTDSALGIYRNHAGKVLRTYPLEEYDRIKFSEDFFDLTGKTGEIAKGDIFVLQPNLVAGTQLKYSATKPTTADAKFYFKVKDVKNSHIPIFFDGENSEMFPSAYKLVTVELLLA